MTTDNSAPVSGSIMVVGGGISGLTTALEAAEVGYEVFLVEKEASLGGRVSQLKHYFPKLCPPTCGLEINYRRLKDNKNIKVLTMSEVAGVDGKGRLPAAPIGGQAGQPARTKARKALQQDDGHAVQDRHPPRAGVGTARPAAGAGRDRLAHVVQQSGYQQVILLIAGPNQRGIDVQAVTLVAAGHPPKEGGLRRR